MLNKIRDSITFYRAVRRANRLNDKTRHRYYVIFDPNSGKPFPVTYDEEVFGQASYRGLRKKGYLKGKFMRVWELKSSCLYFTDSKSGAKRCNKIEMAERLKAFHRIMERRRMNKKNGNEK